MRSLTGLSSEQDFRDLRIEKYQEGGLKPKGFFYFYSAEAFTLFYLSPLAEASGKL